MVGKTGCLLYISWISFQMVCNYTADGGGNGWLCPVMIKASKGVELEDVNVHVRTAKFSSCHLCK